MLLTFKGIARVQVGGDIVIDGQVWSSLGGRKGVIVGNRIVDHAASWRRGSAAQGKWPGEGSLGYDLMEAVSSPSHAWRSPRSTSCHSNRPCGVCLSD